MGIQRLDLATDRDPWERQPHESVKQYARFTCYRDLGRLRTLTQTHKILAATGDPLKYGTLRQTAYEFRWTTRAEPWDIFQDQADREQLIAERRDMIKRHRSVASALLTKAIQALQIIPVAEMEPADVVRYIKLATDIERIAIGEPQRTIAVTGPTGGPIQTEDLTNLTAEERRARLAEIAAELSRRAGISEADEDE
jgi:hypothetical protein